MGTYREQDRRSPIKYTNEMRRAIRSIDNPSPIPVDIVVYEGHIGLRVETTAVKKLELQQQLRFMGYLQHMVDILESFGAPAEVEGFPIGV